MTIEQDLHVVLAAVTPRVYADFAPVATQRPYVTYQQFGGQAVAYVENTVPDLKNGEFQVNVWSDTRKEAAAVMLQIEAALMTATAFSARPVSAAASDYDPDIPVHGSRQDFSVWSDR